MILITTTTDKHGEKSHTHETHDDIYTAMMSRFGFNPTSQMDLEENDEGYLAAIENAVSNESDKEQNLRGGSVELTVIDNAEQRQDWLNEFCDDAMPDCDDFTDAADEFWHDSEGNERTTEEACKTVIAADDTATAVDAWREI